MCWGVRNVVASGLAARLRESGLRVTLLLPKFSDEQKRGLEQENFSVQPLLSAAQRQAVGGRAFLNGICRAAFHHGNRISTGRIFKRWRQRNWTFRQRARACVIESLAWLAQPRPVQDWLLRLDSCMYRRTMDLEPFRKQLQELSPSLLVSTAYVVGSEYPYLLAASGLGIPICVMILSFDNLTSRGRLCTAGLPCRYLLWNDRMAKEIMAFYPGISRDILSVTGTPQFDFHRRADCRWTREVTLGRLGLPRGARYILYAANHHTFTPTEPSMVAELSQRLRAHASLSDLWVVVRRHPMDDAGRWGCMAQTDLKVRLAPTWMSQMESDGWAFLTVEDQGLLVSSLLHAEACLNVASTMSLDAAVLDRPVIGVAFAFVAGSDEDRAYGEFFQTAHYAPLVRSGGLRLARNWGELLALLERAVEHPEEGREARSRMVARECGMVDGQATTRISEEILRMVRRPTPQQIVAVPSSLAD